MRKNAENGFDTEAKKGSHNFLLNNSCVFIVVIFAVVNYKIKFSTSLFPFTDLFSQSVQPAKPSNQTIFLSRLVRFLLICRI